jgi:hypothetical protein
MAGEPGTATASGPSGSTAGRAMAMNMYWLSIRAARSVRREAVSLAPLSGTVMGLIHKACGLFPKIVL